MRGKYSGNLFLVTGSTPQSHKSNQGGGLLLHANVSWQGSGVFVVTSSPRLKNARLLVGPRLFLASSSVENSFLVTSDTTNSFSEKKMYSKVALTVVVAISF